jgi:polar amino acid transport system substrate-binding protein
MLIIKEGGVGEIGCPSGCQAASADDTAACRSYDLFRFIHILLAVALVWALPVQAELVVFQSTETPPYWSSQLPDNGFGGSLLRLLSTQAGVDYSIEYLPVKRFSNRAAAYVVGDPDLLIEQKHSEHRVIFPIGIFHSAFFYYSPQHEVMAVRSLRDMRGHTLGVLRGSIADKSAFLRHGIQVEESDSVESLLKKLKKGRIDFCILVAGSGRYSIQKLFPTEQENFSQVIIPSLTRPLTIMIDAHTPKEKEIAQRYRKVLNKTLHSPQYRAIMKEYFGKEGIPADWDAQMETFIKYYADTWNE